MLTAFDRGSKGYSCCEHAKFEGVSFMNAEMRARCAILPVICAGFMVLHNSSAHFCRKNHPLPYIATAC